MHEGQHSPIVTQDLWDEVQQSLGDHLSAGRPTPFRLDPALRAFGVVKGRIEDAHAARGHCIPRACAACGRRWEPARRPPLTLSLRPPRHARGVDTQRRANRPESSPPASNHASALAQIRRVRSRHLPRPDRRREPSWVLARACVRKVRAMRAQSRCRSGRRVSYPGLRRRMSGDEMWSNPRNRNLRA